MLLGFLSDIFYFIPLWKSLMMEFELGCSNSGEA